MNYELRHFVDFLCILIGLAYAINTIGKSSKNPRVLSLFRLAAVMLLIGGGLGMLHGLPNIDWVHRHSYAIFYYGLVLKNVAFGMMVVFIFLGLPREFEPRQKASRS